ncbi:urease accessory protein UreE [Sinomonas sp. JGH33]|uniref:Urease accessory protein UreE n=1 Tax=Sinomonas terricola TaxID=3110330 RepID=A0ABU5T349_9MICC|nr:urease accessory protein UreE [Sinomonas sp. JGH33]MEA5454093.1 urease accessory protein UreE [Sinomonas sp. JGH33]
MIVTEILGNLHDGDAAAAYGAHHRERVVLPSADLAKRIQRVRTDHGTELGIRLPAGAPDLRDGDILAVAPGDPHGGAGKAHGGTGNVIVVSVEAADVLVIAPRTLGEALFAAHSLGNRHLQAQFFGPDSEIGRAAGQDVMVCQYDHTVQEFLDRHGVPYAREERVMAVPFRHAEHTH